ASISAAASNRFLRSADFGRSGLCRTSKCPMTRGAQVWRITALESNPSGYALEFAAMTYPFISRRPTLSVVFTVPEPNAWALLLVGALLCPGCLRRLNGDEPN